MLQSHYGTNHDYGSDEKGIKVGEKAIYDMEALFSRLLIVGQTRNVSLTSIFEYELCGVPSSIIDEYGLLRKGNKASLLKRPNPAHQRK